MTPDTSGKKQKFTYGCSVFSSWDSLAWGRMLTCRLAVRYLWTTWGQDYELLRFYGMENNEYQCHQLRFLVVLEYYPWLALTWKQRDSSCWFFGFQLFQYMEKVVIQTYLQLFFYKFRYRSVISLEHGPSYRKGKDNCYQGWGYKHRHTLLNFWRLSK